MDRGIVSPGPSGATTAAWEPRISGNPARWGGPGPLSACRPGRGRCEGKGAHGPPGNLVGVMRACGVCGEVASPGGAASPNQCLASPSGGVNGMCVWHVGERVMFLRRRRQLWGGGSQGVWAFQLGTRIC